MHDGYALTVSGEIKAVNGALCELTGFSEAELVGARVPFPFWPPERLDETMMAPPARRGRGGRPRSRSR